MNTLLKLEMLYAAKRGIQESNTPLDSIQHLVEEVNSQAEDILEAYVTARVKEAIATVQKDSDDMSRFIAALLVQSGGSVTVTKRTLTEIPTPSTIHFEQLSNIDGGITMSLVRDHIAALTATTNGKGE